MATVVYSAQALSHLERAFEFLASENPDAAIAAASAIRSAVENLAAHPLLGRRVHGDIRELVISFGQTATSRCTDSSSHRMRLGCLRSDISGKSDSCHGHGSPPGHTSVTRENIADGK